MAGGAGTTTHPFPSQARAVISRVWSRDRMPGFHWNRHVSWLSPVLQMRATVSLAYTSAQKHMTLDVIMPISMVDFPLANTTIYFLKV